MHRKMPCGWCYRHRVLTILSLGDAENRVVEKNSGKGNFWWCCTQEKEVVDFPDARTNRAWRGILGRSVSWWGKTFVRFAQLVRRAGVTSCQAPSRLDLDF